ncbi:MAG: efflux pump, inner rane subunit [Acidobacteriales bacterium]|nr:efflux pump, inner rane subunit [Terriglobales bacterium]
MKLQLSENAKMALETVRENKIRSILTVSGVVIGITTVIAVASILVGVSRNIEESLNDFGVNTLFIFKFTPGPHFGRLSTEERMRKPLTLEDGMAIQDSCPAVKKVSVQVFPRVGVNRPADPLMRYNGHETDVNFSGVTPAFETVQNLHISKGRFFSETENDHHSDLIVLGYDAARALFPDENGIGKTVQFGTQSFSVVGILEQRKTNVLRGGGSDNQALIPYLTYRKHNPNNDEHFISAEAYPGMKAAAEDQVRGILRQRRRVAFSAPDSFGISSAEQIADQLRQVTASVALLTVAISSIGLLVGGVGVMNIMLMSVTERTREIGVRKALGARKRDISWQFLTEAMTLTGCGGTIGVFLGVAISFTINKLVPALPSAVPAWAIVAGVMVSMSVGLFFGIYPAVKAARLDPVDALRYE